MNKSQKRITASAALVLAMTIVTVPLAGTRVAAAKWLSWGKERPPVAVTWSSRDAARTEAPTVEISIPAEEIGTRHVVLDYDLIVKNQIAVDEGRELWRLDPVKVAAAEGTAYGFKTTDTYTLVRKAAKGSISDRGEADVLVVHNGQQYLVTLIKPLGKDEGAIWTIYSIKRVTGNQDNDPGPPAGNILYQRELPGVWKWDKSSLPKDLAFTVIADYAYQLQWDQRIPASALSAVKDVDYNKYVAVFAYLGQMPTGGHDIAIDKITRQGNNVTVRVRLKSPAPGQPVTMALTAPSAYVLLDRSKLDLAAGVTFTFVDMNGKVLGKVKLTVR